MRRVALFLSIASLAMIMLSCGGSTEKKSTETAKTEVTETAKVMVYYFHSKQRCKTCLAIQDVAAQTIAENFAENADVKFLELDYTEKANEAISTKYEIAGSSLIIVSGNEHVNLTSAAFANAVRNPDVLKETISNEVNNRL
ncbi:MAG: nitrophenyl compound nitroreductase subunit ArsF family protein [Bacteroidales bacterium]|nr:nitrophenyl compound nitroreductase subunit ArsF family protein [Bacteroidales bacterium]